MQPTVIQGPAYVNRSTLWAYMDESGNVVDYRRESWEPKGSITGSLGPRHKSTRIVASGTPMGEVETLTGYWPYVAADIGGSIFSATPLVVVPKTGNKITFPRSAVTKLPTLRLAPLRTAFGPMEWTALGDPTVEPNNAAY